jgi:hypothetical protein
MGHVICSVKTGPSSSIVKLNFFNYFEKISKVALNKYKKAVERNNEIILHFATHARHRRCSESESWMLKFPISLVRDSSTYKKILDAQPYHKPVEKIECRNHLLRNYCNKLRSIAGDTHFPLKLRKLLSERILRLRTAVTGEIKFRRSMSDSISNKIKLLKQDIDNSLYRVFGCHDSCDAYFCKKKKMWNY